MTVQTDYMAKKQAATEEEVVVVPASNVVQAFAVTEDVVPMAGAIPSPEATATLEIGTLETRNTVEVIAPTDMMGGYRFNADVGGGKSMLVEVVCTMQILASILSLEVFTS